MLCAGKKKTESHDGRMKERLMGHMESGNYAIFFRI